MYHQTFSTEDHNEYSSSPDPPKKGNGNHVFLLSSQLVIKWRKQGSTMTKYGFKYASGQCDRLL